MSQLGKHAIIIGGSISGLLTARVLSDFFAQVTILERDSLPQGGEYRNGAPQAKHLHVLLARGQHIMEQLLPGISAELTATGAPQLQWGMNQRLYTPSGLVGKYDSGITVNACGRASLEWLVRQRIQQIPNVTFITETDVEDVVIENGVVVGVVLQARKTRGASETLRGDFVVDASGRRSKAPVWLQAHGYPAPAETIINAHTGYATRWYTFDGELPADPCVIVQARPKMGFYRGAGYMLTEGGQMVVTVLGANSDYPPTDETGFMAFLQSLPVPDLYEVVQRATPITPIYAYRGLENQMRHYERVAQRPENFIITGDAAVAFNPIYGQGMTSAAMQAEVLANLLCSAQGLTGFAAQFQQALAQNAQEAWLLSTSEDMRYPLVEGAKPNFRARLFHRYTDLIGQAINHDAVVAATFAQVLNMVKPASALMHPTIIGRVLWQVLRRRETVAQVPAKMTSTQWA
jgi:2-polyprenyl-6-methoxyphenol hydroxylase-like FAD-dependent oxidoreductase